MPEGAFGREDEGEDAGFYAEPRLTTHIDEAAIAALTRLYRSVLPPGGTLLDLMSSWISHLPADVAYREVIGVGMNAVELAANPRLDRRIVRDLNRDPLLPIADASLDAAMICVSIQYLQQPTAVLTELARALRPGAPVVVAFSNRCFPTKAVAIWRWLDPADHAHLVALYLERAGFVDIEARMPRDGRDGDPLTVLLARAPGSHTA